MPRNKNYNVPAQITDSVRREERMKRERDIRERSTEDNISPAEKEKLRRMIEEDSYADVMSSSGGEDSYRDDAYAKGGMVKKKKYAMGGSVRGGGIAIKGVGKGKVC
jgi:hypothetical protein